MKGVFYIDGEDAYSRYGVFVTEGGYNDLVRYAPLKSVASNNWQEEDGEEFDLSAPVLDSREVSIKLAIHGSDYKLGAFMETLYDRAYHSLEFKDLERTYKLRLTSQVDIALAHRLGLMTLQFADDFPLEGYEYRAPSCSIVPGQGYDIDGVDLSKYGVRILEGSSEEIEKSPAVKKNLLRNINTKSGAIYDDQKVVFESKNVNIKCLMRASSMEEFWQNYDALLFDLSRPNERVLYVDATGYEYPCFYNSCSVASFALTDKTWFAFSLMLVFTSFRAGGDEYILTSQEDQLIMTEENNFVIDLGE